LPEEPELLEAGLGLSAALTDDLKAWGRAWNKRPPHGDQGEDRDVRRERLLAEAVVLVDRMRGELKEGLRVELDLR
jgi:hypothetical protein